MLPNSVVDLKPPFVKYPKIPYIEESPELFGRECYFLEKIDGSLSQVRRTKEGLAGGSKADYISGNSLRPYWAPHFLKWMHSNSSLYNLKSDLIMFGEWLAPVTVDYDAQRLNKFYFLDLATVNQGNLVFFDYLEATNYLREWGIQDVEILDPIGKEFLTPPLLENIVLDSLSALKDGEMEGVVVKNYSLQLFSKKLHPSYSEIREEEKILENKYINPPRIGKALRRLHDSGRRAVNLDELVDEVKKDVESEAGISFKKESITGVIRARNLFSESDG